MEFVFVKKKKKLTTDLVNVMQLINHGVCSSYEEKLKMEIQDFFNLPMSEKKKFGKLPNIWRDLDKHLL
jgi:hypothetical protein